MAEGKKWRALDHHCKSEATVEQAAEQVNISKQKSRELIVIRDSEDVEVQTTDTQAAVSLQLALQAALVAVISITIGDTDRSRAVVQELDQLVKTKQSNFQKTIVENSRCVRVTTTDTDVAVNVQALLQILVAVVVKLDVL
ncbi:spore coat protein [Bacillus sp. DJP31]|uniref:spore coat protein n=1 Tax=Bacillus sp. DJP31 TaxID=3409789 RepID=UPI003BB639BA